MLEDLKDALRSWVGPALATYSYDDLQVATNDFHKEHIIGSGATGTVYRGVLRGATDVAIKVLQSKEDACSFDEELKALTWIRHPNIVALLGYGENQGWKYLVYELLKGGSVARRLWRCRQIRLCGAQSAPKESFSWQQRLRVACDASCGLSYMVNSEPQAFHRDIKPSNILIDEHGTAKLSDFGLVGIAANQSTFVVEYISGTPGYICPVYFETGEVTEASEVFSFGVVLLELLVNKDAAALGLDGGITYPLSQALRYTHAGAYKRVVACLDSKAEWPPAIAGAVSVLALACVADSRQRLLFVQIVQELRRIAMGSPVGGGGAGVTPEQKKFHPAPMTPDRVVRQPAAIAPQHIASEDTCSDAESFYTIVPDSYSGPRSYAPSESSFGTTIQNGFNELLARGCVTICSSAATLHQHAFALETGEEISQDFSSQIYQRGPYAAQAPSAELIRQGACCSKAKLRAELSKRPRALKVDLDRRSLLI